MPRFTVEEQTEAINEVHSVLDRVTMGNSHGALSGIGGTARTGTKVKVIRGLLAVQQQDGGTLLDIGVAYGHMMLGALVSGFDGACGCELPANEVQRRIVEIAKDKLRDRIDPETTCEWIAANIMDLVLSERLRRKITSVYAFWNGIGLGPQLRTLEMVRDTLINVRSVAVYLDKGWQTPASGMKMYILNPCHRSRSDSFFQPVLTVLNEGAIAPNWILYDTIQHFSVGKGSKHTAWVFHRQAPPAW